MRVNVYNDGVWFVPERYYDMDVAPVVGDEMVFESGECVRVTRRRLEPWADDKTAIKVWVEKL